MKRENKTLQSNQNKEDYLLTVKTYDNSAIEMAKHFKNMGSRIAHVELGLQLANAGSDARAVEIGCGDGYDAAEIIKRTKFYVGFDPSKGLLKIAQNLSPKATFILSDAQAYDYPENIDVIYAFASLLHVNKSDLRSVFKKIAKSLRSDGVLLISLKEHFEYKRQLKEDEYGLRVLYLYNPKLIEELAGNNFKVIYKEHYIMNKTPWFRLGLQKA